MPEVVEWNTQGHEDDGYFKCNLMGVLFRQRPLCFFKWVEFSNNFVEFIGRSNEYDVNLLEFRDNLVVE